MIVKFKKVHPKARKPKKSTAGSACFDLHAVSREWDEDLEVEKYGTGIAVEIPEGHVGLLFPRSSICKTMLRMANCVGVIDSDYRGEISAVFDIAGAAQESYDEGDRVAQLMILPVPDVKWVECDELTSTERGEGGYGSTGK